MTPWLRLTLRLARLLLVLAVALPAYDISTAYGTAHAYRTEPAPSRSPGPTAAVPSPAAHAHRSASPSASPSTHGPAVQPSRAGSRPGEGRMRPGRPDGPAAEVEGDDNSVPHRVPDTDAARPEEPETADPPAGTAGTPTATPPDEAQLPPHTVHQGEGQPQAEASEPVLRILPLGSGLVLIGLGLGLTFLGLRIRRS
ncbi:hypothetical protein [Streptomyces sp. NPDC002671]